MNNQKWRVIYIYIYMCVYTYHMYIYLDIYSENVKFIIVNLRLDVEQYIFTTISFRLTMMNFTFSEYICIHTHRHTHIYIYILCIAVILALYRIFIIVCYFDILLLYKKIHSK